MHHSWGPGPLLNIPKGYVTINYRKHGDKISVWKLELGVMDQQNAGHEKINCTTLIENQYGIINYMAQIIKYLM
jgi:hypothetical protein